MRIVFYSTNSNVFDDETFKINVRPKNAAAFEKFCAAHPEHDFFCVTQKPGMFLPEVNNDNQICYLPKDTDTETFSEKRIKISNSFYDITREEN